jgi:hypothetical protein
MLSIAHSQVVRREHIVSETLASLASAVLAVREVWEL